MGEENKGVKIRILLADDNEAILRHVEKLLPPSFDVVGAVSDGESLVEQTAALHPDIVVTDISMPVMSGIEAVSELKRLGLKTRVLFLSVFQRQSFVDACFSAGADGFVSKARLTRDLVPALEEVMAGRKFGLNGRQN